MLNQCADASNFLSVGVMNTRHTISITDSNDTAAPFVAETARRRRLSDFISHYEPVYYDRQTILQRSTRSAPDSELPLRFTMHAYGR